MALYTTYALTAFLSASLLFVVQPMVGKFVLPALGGATAVWSACLVFFQAALLLGYVYAHGMSRLPRRVQPVVHIGLLALAFLFLPISFDLVAIDVQRPAWTLVAALVSSIGLPFVLASASAPLLQSWFSRSGHPSAADPYHLYAASNAGSLAGLLGYPLLLEPWLALGAQSEFWRWGFAAMIAAFVVSAVLALLWKGDGARRGNDGATVPSPSVSLRAFVWWVVLAALPSALMVAATTAITTDVAAVPLLWVAPLSVYLLVFILAFARRAWISERGLWATLPVVVVVLVSVLLFKPRGSVLLLVLVHLAGLFVLSLAVVRELVRRRPQGSHLTVFYLALAFGGVGGGALVTFAAPLVFVNTWEYPLVIAGCVLVVGWLRSSEGHRGFYAAGATTVAASVVAGLAHASVVGLRFAEVPVVALALTPVLAVVASLLFFVLVRSRRRFAVAAVLSLVFGVSASAVANQPVFSGRSFFASHRVVVEPESATTVLYHGSTNHGAQSSDPRLRRWSLPYHHPGSPAAELFDDVRTRLGATAPVAVGGLGVGGLASLVGPGQPVTFYEIDPVVVQIATEPRFFDFMEKCRGKAEVVVGDARVALRGAPRRSYALIVLDAFSSGSIPVHLVTVEATSEYLERLAPGGLVAFHVSNRYVDLRPMLAAVADDLGLAVLTRVRAAETRQGVDLAPTTFVVMARSDDDLAALAVRGWRTPPPATAQPFTDSFSNIIGVLGSARGGVQER